MKKYLWMMLATFVVAALTCVVMIDRPPLDQQAAQTIIDGTKTIAEIDSLDTWTAAVWAPTKTKDGTAHLAETKKSDGLDMTALAQYYRDDMEVTTTDKTVYVAAPQILLYAHAGTLDVTMATGYHLSGSGQEATADAIEPHLKLLTHGVGAAGLFALL